MALKLILGGLLNVIFPSFEVQKPGTGDRDVQWPPQRKLCIWIRRRSQNFSKRHLRVRNRFMQRLFSLCLSTTTSHPMSPLTIWFHDNSSSSLKDDGGRLNSGESYCFKMKIQERFWWGSKSDLSKGATLPICKSFPIRNFNEVSLENTYGSFYMQLSLSIALPKLYFTGPCKKLYLYSYAQYLCYFLVTNCNSIRGFVRPSVGPSVRQLVRRSRVFFFLTTDNASMMFH